MEKISIGNEEVFLKKDWTGWRVVEPLVHPDTRVFIWKNFFSKKGFIVLAFIMLLLGCFYLAGKEQIANFKKVMDNPCAYCEDCRVQKEEILKYYKNPSIPQINFSVGSDEE